MQLEMIKLFIEYHVDMTRRVWDSVDKISEEQFLSDYSYSRGSIRNLMVHLAGTDLVDSGKRKFKIASKNGKPVIGKTTWTKTILDVRTQNAGLYCEDVKAWALSALEDSEGLRV
jgi:hypothetical protein